MFIGALLFIIGKEWKQPKRLSADEQIKKIWYIHILKHYSAWPSKSWPSGLEAGTWETNILKTQER